MPQHQVTTETTGDSTEITVGGLFRMTIVNSLATIHLDNENVYVGRQDEAGVITIAPFHPRLAYLAPELHDQVRAELGL